MTAIAMAELKNTGACRDCGGMIPIIKNGVDKIASEKLIFTT